ncbi:MAG TPA: TIGR03087 family PEP-CTERM/XrtA system glycosyltransferase [Planctomycetota bacterium]|nr:TIGR03087 family PEP-CTERM/XrtA system glycosyltransferase [Planctomycetota bacterium]
MRVMLVCHRFPYPPSSGAKIRSYHILRHLAQEHEVTVAAPCRSAEEREEGKGLEGQCHRVLTDEIPAAAARLRMVGNLPTRTPSSMGYFLSPRLVRRVREELATRDYDLVLAHSSSVAPYVADVQGPAKILDFADMDSQKWLAYARVRPFPLSLGYWIEGTKLRRAEEELARKFDVCTCATRAEAETLEGYRTGVPAEWFPNGADVDYFQPSPHPYDPDTICFVGKMDYFPNSGCMVDFCARTLPLLRARRPAIKLLIVGSDPSPAVRRLARIPGVTVTGAVKDVRPYVARSAASVAPLSLARGTQNKILESLAMGVPVVSSDVAAKGVDCVPGEHMLVASTPAEYADAVLRLLDDPAERRRFAEAGRARILSHHTWSRAMRRFGDIVRRVTRGGTSAPPAVAAGSFRNKHKDTE